MWTKEFTIKGFPTQITDHIELPNIHDLIKMPFIYNADIDEVYKHGPSDYRTLLDSLKLTGGKASIIAQVQLLYPGVQATANFTDVSDFEWHYDGMEQPFDSEKFFKTHLLLSQCTALTEFNETEVEVDLPISINKPSFSKFIHEQGDALGIKGKKMPSNKFVTFDTHLHRVTAPKDLEFRFMFRVLESFYVRPVKWNDALRSHSSVFPYGTGNSQALVNIEQLDGSSLIRI